MIDKSEIGRYLGIKGEADALTVRLIDECLKELMPSVRTAYTFKIFNITDKKDGVKIEDCNILLQGEETKIRFCGCTKCAIMGATLGVEADNIIRMSQCIDMAKAVVYDACATYMVEKLCDEVQAEIKALAAKEGMRITGRFSPGYQGLPLSLQRQVCDAIDLGKKIGVFLTDELLLTPTKSVTAFVGIGKPDNIVQKGCKICNMREKCSYSQGWGG